MSKELSIYPTWTALISLIIGMTTILGTLLVLAINAWTGDISDLRVYVSGELTTVRKEYNSKDSTLSRDLTELRKELVSKDEQIQDRMINRIGSLESRIAEAQASLSRISERLTGSESRVSELINLGQSNNLVERESYRREFESIIQRIRVLEARAFQQNIKGLNHAKKHESRSVRAQSPSQRTQ